jgi:hypothetical protein
MRILRIALYVIAVILIWSAIGSLFFSALAYMNIHAQPTRSVELSPFAHRFLLMGIAETITAACLFYVAYRYIPRAARTVVPPPVLTGQGEVKPVKGALMIRVIFYVVAVLCIGWGAQTLVLQLGSLVAGSTGVVHASAKEGLLITLRAVIAILLGIYFFRLGIICIERPGKDVRPYIRQGGFLLLGLGLALLVLGIWMAMPYFRGYSDNMALMGLVFGMPAIVVFWICGVAALIVGRRQKRVE